MSDDQLNKTPDAVNVDYSVLHVYADKHRLHFNGLCEMVRSAVAATTTLPSVQDDWHRHISAVKRTSDQSVQLSFPSCRTASLCENALRPGAPQSVAVGGNAKQTDLSKRLRPMVHDGSGTLVMVSKDDLTAACNEIDRYYTGMMNWKASAEAKDAATADDAVAVAIYQATASDSIWCDVDNDELWAKLQSAIGYKTRIVYTHPAPAPQAVPSEYATLQAVHGKLADRCREISPSYDTSGFLAAIKTVERMMLSWKPAAAPEAATPSPAVLDGPGSLFQAIMAMQLPIPFDRGDGNHEDKFTESQMREFRASAAAITTKAQPDHAAVRDARIAELTYALQTARDNPGGDDTDAIIDMALQPTQAIKP